MTILKFVIIVFLFVSQNLYAQANEKELNNTISHLKSSTGSASVEERSVHKKYKSTEDHAAGRSGELNASWYKTLIIPFGYNDGSYLVAQEFQPLFSVIKGFLSEIKSNMFISELKDEEISTISDSLDISDIKTRLKAENVLFLFVKEKKIDEFNYLNIEGRYFDKNNYIIEDEFEYMVENQNEEILLKRAISDVIARFNNIKELDKFKENKITFHVEIRDLDHWIKIRNKLENIHELGHIYIDSLSTQHAVISINFPKGFDKLACILSNHDLILQKSINYYELVDR